MNFVDFVLDELQRAVWDAQQKMFARRRERARRKAMRRDSATLMDAMKELETALSR